MPACRKLLLVTEIARSMRQQLPQYYATTTESCHHHIRKTVAAQVLAFDRLGCDESSSVSIGVASSTENSVTATALATYTSCHFTLRSNAAAAL